MKDWEKEFDEKFIQFDKHGLPVGGLEQAPYNRIKQFIAQAVKEAKAEAIRDFVKTIRLNKSTSKPNSMWADIHDIGKAMDEYFIKLEEEK